MFKNKIQEDKNEQLINKLYTESTGYTIEESERLSILDKGGDPTYGEITFTGAKILLRDLRFTYKDIFYDLGSGIGKMVTQAYLTTPAKKTVGIELALTRHKLALKVQEELQKIGKVQENRELIYVNGDIVNVPIDDATIIYICSTCFSEELMSILTLRLSGLKHGLRVATLKKLAPNSNFILLKEYKLPMSWYTEVTVYLYRLEK